MTHGLSDEAVFRLQLDVKRLNTENRELRRRLNIPLDGRTVTIAVDNSVDMSTPVDTIVDTPGKRNASSDAGAGDKDRAAYKREWMAKKRAAEKLKNSTPI